MNRVKWPTYAQLLLSRLAISEKVLMRFGGVLVLLAVQIAGIAAYAQEISWQNAVAQLESERGRVTTCARLLKQYGDTTAIKSGRILYDEAKTEYDSVIFGLQAALAQRDSPGSFSDLQWRMQRGLKYREAFCDKAQSLNPGGFGGIGDEIFNNTIGALWDAISAAYYGHLDDYAGARQQIETLLLKTKWPDFASIAP
jgi:hypothetical protein